MLFFVSAPYLRRMKLKDWNEAERPREKLVREGAAALSNAELLAIFIGSGVPGANAVDVAQELLSLSGGRLSELYGRPLKELQAVKSIGPARAVAITAALELGRRYLAEEAAPSTVITGPEDVVRFMRPLLKGLDHEECWALYLNRANRVTGREKVTSGTVDGTFIDTKRILRHVIERQARAVILVHNHPSGNPCPGETDIRATRQLQLALRTFEAQLFDHVILSDGSWYSFQDERIGKSK